MKIFVERQISWLIVVVSIVFTYNITHDYIYQVGTRPVTLTVLLILLPLVLIPLLLFYKMTTIVYSDKVEVRYGFGVIKRTFYLRDLDLGHVKKIPWYCGAGIKYYTDGTLYSINFTDAVEFRLKHSRKSVSFGSKNPEVLMRGINREIEKLGSSV